MRGITAAPVRRRRLIWPVASTLALVVLVVAVPIGLLEVGGWPVSHAGLGAMSRLSSSLHADDDRVVARYLVAAALTLAWISWAWMTVCVVLEIRSWATGRSSTRLPASRTFQSVAACLVGTALAMSAMARASTASRPMVGIVASGAGSAAVDASPSYPSLRVIDDTRLTSDPDPHLQAPAGDRAATDRVATGGPPVTVRLPDGGDSEMVVSEPDGPTSSLFPGASQRPASPPTGAVPAEHLGASHGATQVHVVMARETLWSIALDRLGSALRWRELANLNYGIRQADGRSLTTEHWITPGWRLLVPSTDRETRAATGEVPIARRPASRPTVSAANERWVSGSVVTVLPEWPSRPTTGRTPPRVEEEDGPPPVLPERRPPAVPVGGGIVGVGVVRLLDRMRRVQQRHRPEGTMIQLPDRTGSAFEQRLRMGDGSSLITDVDRSLRLLASACSHAECDSPAVKGIRVQPDSIEVVIDGLDAADREVLERQAAQIHFTEEGSSVLVDRATLGRWSDPSGGYRPDRSIAPLLVSVGSGPAGVVMVNLETLGSLVVSGSAADGEAMVRALALEMATSHWAGQFDLVLVGFGAELERFDRVTAMTEVPALVRRLCRRRISGTELLRSSGFSSFAGARTVDESAVWDPLVVICGPMLAQSDVIELLEVASDVRRGTAVVALGEEVEAVHAVSLSGGDRAASLELLGSVVFPHQVESDELTEVGALLDTATNRTSVLSSDEPYMTIPIRLPAAIEDGGNGAVRPPIEIPPPPGPTAGNPSNPHSSTVSAVSAVSAVSTLGNGGASLEATGHGDQRVSNQAGPERAVDVKVQVDFEVEVEVEVSVLGPIEIRGAARDFTRAWARELVVYLAMHPNGASNEAWATALWPDRLMAPSSLHSTASVARRSLGQAADGLDHLPRSHGRLALSRSVRTDWDCFVTLVDSKDVGQWRSALELIRGRPFEGLRSSDWPILEGIGPAIEAAVVDLSGRLAGAYLRAGDPRSAEWAARKGLLVSPYDERLYRMLLRAADASGNPAGVEAVMTELIRLVADDIEPLDSVHPSTMDLYRSLTRRRSLTPTTR